LRGPGFSRVRLVEAVQVIRQRDGIEGSGHRQVDGEDWREDDIEPRRIEFAAEGAMDIFPALPYTEIKRPLLGGPFSHSCPGER
jgi:hypothetical protein